MASKKENQKTSPDRNVKQTWEKIHEYQFPDYVTSEPATYLSEDEPALTCKSNNPEFNQESPEIWLRYLYLNPQFIGWEIHSYIFDAKHEDEVLDYKLDVDYEKRTVSIFVLVKDTDTPSRELLKLKYEVRRKTMCPMCSLFTTCVFLDNETTLTKLSPLMKGVTKMKDETQIIISKETKRRLDRISHEAKTDNYDELILKLTNFYTLIDIGVKDMKSPKRGKQ